ncbi:hypothetical protein EVA_20925 [gut metagenome]|uniref:Uncharacterized protein n=1 Tax=gut metagenome TaxID=749906 RepID=J9FUB8_9ZZZZ
MQVFFTVFNTALLHLFYHLVDRILPFSIFHSNTINYTETSN